MMSLIALGFVSLIAALTAVILITTAGAFRWYVLGALHIGMLAVTLHVLNSAFHAFDAQQYAICAALGVRTTRAAS